MSIERKMFINQEGEGKCVHVCAYACACVLHGMPTAALFINLKTGINPNIHQLKWLNKFKDIPQKNAHSMVLKTKPHHPCRHGRCPQYVFRVRQIQLFTRQNRTCQQVRVCGLKCVKKFGKTQRAVTVSSLRTRIGQLRVRCGLPSHISILGFHVF